MSNIKSFLNLSWLGSSSAPNCCFKKFFGCFKENQFFKNDKIKKLVKFILLMAIILATSIAVTIYLDNHKNNHDKIIAKIGRERIYQSEMNDILQQMLPGTDSEVQLAKLPKEMIEILAKDIFIQKELEKKARRAGILRNKLVKKKIGDFVKKTAREEYLNYAVKDKITEEAVRNKYVELTSEVAGKKEVHIRYILVSSEDKALKILRELKAKNSFESLAKKYSLDENSAKIGGDLGYVIEDNLPKELAVAQMKSGSVSKPIKSEYGWYIIKVEQKRDAHIAPFESVKSALQDQLKKDEIKKIFSEITDKVKVEVLFETPAIDKTDKENNQNNQDNKSAEKNKKADDKKADKLNDKEKENKK